MKVVNEVPAVRASQVRSVTQSDKSNIVPGWLSHAEKNFIKVLSAVVGDHAFIFVKVKVNDVLRHTTINDEYDEVYDYRDKVFDYVLCDKNDLSVKCAIELDDRPHALQKLYSEYSYESLCKAVEIPLLEIPARCGYDHALLGKYVKPYLNLSN